MLVAAGVGVQLVRSDALAREPAYLPFLAFGGVMLAAVAVIVIDALVRRKRIDTISAVYVGLIVGLFLTYVMRLALSALIEHPLLPYFNLMLGTVLCYTFISVLLQTKDDFRFIIP